MLWVWLVKEYCGWAKSIRRFSKLLWLYKYRKLPSTSVYSNSDPLLARVINGIINYGYKADAGTTYPVAQ